MTIGSKDFTGVVCLNGEGSATYEHSLALAQRCFQHLGLLQHQVKILPAEASVLVDAPDVDLVLIDARHDLPTVKSLTKLLHSTGVGCPIIAITTEGGLTAFNADWGIDDVISRYRRYLPKLMHVFASHLASTLSN